LLKKEDGVVDWSLPAPAIHNRVRGLQPWPGAHTTFRGQTLHIWKSRPAPRPRPAEAAGTPPGRIVAVKPLVLSCGSGALELLEVQLEGRKRISGADFANGRHLAENEDMGGPHL
jgi:methionyl-tRNA formyltransferase